MNMKLEENQNVSRDRKTNLRSMKDHVKAYRDANYTHDASVYEKQIQKFEADVRTHIRVEQ